MASTVPHHALSPDPNLLTPEDAYYSSPPRLRRVGTTPSPGIRGSASTDGLNSLAAVSTATSNGSGPAGRSRKSRSRRRQQQYPRDLSSTATRWKKLLWIKQPYPDNYTDASTFLSHLQWNPRFQAYEFWPLVADSTVIVQHICAVALFVCCFVGIYQERISPVAVVGTATAASMVGWVMWDIWLGRDEREKEVRDRELREKNAAASTAAALANANASLADGNGKTTGFASTTASGGGGGGADGINGSNSSGLLSTASTSGLGISTPASMASGSVSTSRLHSRNPSSTSLATYANTSPPYSTTGSVPSALASPIHSFHPSPTPILSIRNQQRLATAKSALLIYLALLGLSPILKSLTLSTTSDSIWAMSGWLLLTNIFTFDYGSSAAVPGNAGATDANAGVSVSSADGGTSSGPALTRFPASLSTNAALMASTVLASRLPHTTHVFSLTLFSIEVFGLFPVFRRHLRARSFALHILLTVLLILGSGAALGIALLTGGSSGSHTSNADGHPIESGWRGDLTAAVIGAVVWSFCVVVAMGGCSWWLIGLQRYKNVVIGPWDPARPIIRAGGWD